jgi:hypothetical protein
LPISIPARLCLLLARACSVGTRCYLSLLADADRRSPLFLQVTA